MGAPRQCFIGADPVYATGGGVQGVGALGKACRHGLSAAASIGSIKWVGGNLGRMTDLIGISTGAHWIEGCTGQPLHFNLENLNLLPVSGYATSIREGFPLMISSMTSVN